MYVDKDKNLTKTVIKNAIEENEELRKGFSILEDYYRGKHDIINREKPDTAKNNIVVTNHAKYITDINVGYFMGSPVDYNFGDLEDKAIAPLLEQYRNQHISDLDNEIAKDCSIFGKQYEITYVDEDNNCRSADIDVRNAFIIYDDTVARGEKWGVIYSFKDEDTLDRVTVYDEKYEYDCLSGSEIVIPDTGDESRVKEHAFGMIPIIEFKNNSEEMGDFEPVMHLIDAYNILQSDRINDKEQLVEALLIGYGFDLEDKQKKELVMNRMAFGLPKKSEAEMTYLTKNLDESQIEILRKAIVEDIHKISQTPNMSDENFVGNSSGVAIRYKLIAFEQSINNKQRYFERGLLKRLELYKNYLVSIKALNPSTIDLSDTKVVFKRNLPQNDLEIAQMISLLQRIIDDETLAGQLSFVEDAATTIKLNREEEQERYEREAPQFGTNNPTNLEEDEDE
jgi:SPP1 family phage portal protein